MSLPTTTTPTYNLTVPSTKQKIKFRPYYVKEEKVLFTALESREPQQIADAIENLVTACVLTPDFTLEGLSVADIEYIFINIRSEAVGSTVDLVVYAPDDETTEVPCKIDISKIKVIFSKGHTKQFEVKKDLWIEMKYPSLQDYVEFDEGTDGSFSLASKCIVKMWNDEQVWDEGTTTQEEMLTFVETLTSHEYKKIKHFFDTMPELKHVIKLKNPNTKFEFQYTVRGITDFFA